MYVLKKQNWKVVFLASSLIACFALSAQSASRSPKHFSTYDTDPSADAAPSDKGAESSAQDAAPFDKDAESSAQDAAPSDKGAESSAQDAAPSDKGVESSAQDAAPSDKGVESSAQDAAPSDKGAESSAQDAAPSDKSAESSAQDAAPSDKDAESSAQDAAPSDKSAESSAQDAAPSDKDAESSAQDAAPSDKDAESSAQDAAPSDKGAESSAQDAAPSDKDAESSAQDAAPSDKDAESSAQDAAPSDKSAESSAQDAAPSDKDAESSAQDAAPSDKGADSSDLSVIKIKEMALENKASLLQDNDLDKLLNMIEAVLEHNSLEDTQKQFHKLFDKDGSAFYSCFSDNPPLDKELSLLSPQVLYKKGYDFILSANYVEAEKAFCVFQDRYRKDPLGGDALFWLAESLLGQKRYYEAAQTYLTVWYTDKKKLYGSEILLKLAVSMAALGQNKEACALFDNISNHYKTLDCIFCKRLQEERSRARCSLD
ncbi:tetratricopeptide repeat protein [Bartonella sp. CB74]|uniref:tetratricopeptide repeat protein n=1 Tax=Bartonella sp. CB74 TaxID=3113620 RepID=UPI002F965BD1